MKAVKTLAALGIVGAMLPLGAPAHAAGKKPAYSGFATESHATPVHIEIYEPTVPIPADPQAEVSFGYSTVEADSSSSTARASYLWPGDAVGEGFKTIVENLGFPESISGPLGKGGYPIQVNADSQSQTEQKDEPFPGMVMRARAGDRSTTAQTGYSTDCQVDDNTGSSDDGGKGDGGGGPGIPSVPGLPPLPLPTGTPGAAPSSRSASSGTKAEDKSSCQIPDQLKALVDFGGYISTSEFRNTGQQVAAVSHAAVTDVELLGGLITISDVHAGSTALSNGRQGDPQGRTGYGTLAIAGQEFTLGPEGVEAAGHTQEIPGLPDQPAKALKQLGVTIANPKPKSHSRGAQAESDVAGLVVTIETAKLRNKLDAIPFDDIVNQIPDQAGDLKKALGAAVHLSPKFVITLGDAHTAVDTVQGIAIPTTPVTGVGNTGGGAPAVGGGGAATGSGTGVSTPSAPSGGSAPSADGNLNDAKPAAAGLPPLYSLPGALLFGGIALASAAGSYLRKIGVLALGGAGSCAHGLDSGLPDLRKA